MATGKLLYLDDLTAGQRFTSAKLTVSAQAIREFAAQYDPQPFHTDEEAARHSFFQGLAASGWHTAALTMRLVVDSLPIGGGLVGAGTELSWPQATRPGDELQVVSTVLAVAPSKSKPDRGIVTLQSDTFNQRGELCQRCTSKIVVFRKKSADN
ncbi:MAG: MaoC family dehydratase [Burkholderiaceae bacterium]|nr:MaoC family dehydratase [Burkholderiaceae bacterium]